MKKSFLFTILSALNILSGCSNYNQPGETIAPDIFYVSNYTEFTHAITASKTDDYVFVQSDIDFNGNTLEVNKSITIKSLVKKKLFDSFNYTTRTPLILVTANNVCFDNLIIQGNTNSYQNLGIVSNGNTGLLIQNCEICDFRDAGISLGNNSRADIISNYIHNQPDTDGLGYGVVLESGAFATIQSNVFDFNRHDIAGTGAPFTGYEASYNTTSNSTNHAFDMHGNAQNCDVPANDHIAGYRILIHHNTFNNINQYAIDIRGIPGDYCKIYDNTFVQSYILDACFKQEIEENRQANGCGSVPDENDAYGKIFISHNNFTGSAPGTSNFQVKYDGNWNRLIGTSYSIDNIAFGDFNGDGITDIFFPYQDEWKISISALIAARHLNYSPIPLNDLGFGDFDKDGTTDIISTWSDTLWISYSGSSSWSYLNSSSYTIQQLYIDDVNIDGKTDIIGFDGSIWKYSSGGSGDWQNCPAGYTPPANDRLNHRRTLHDFNGDGTNDEYRIQ